MNSTTGMSITIGADNQPIIGYTDATNGDLKAAAVAVTVTGVAFG